MVADAAPILLSKHTVLSLWLYLSPWRKNAHDVRVLVSLKNQKVIWMLKDANLIHCSPIHNALKSFSQLHLELLQLLFAYCPVLQPPSSEPSTCGVCVVAVACVLLSPTLEGIVTEPATWASTRAWPGHIMRQDIERVM